MMQHDGHCQTWVIDPHELAALPRVWRHRKPKRDAKDESGPYSYRMKMGQATVQLEPVEYRILAFLAARPYHAYTRRQIAIAVSRDLDPVTEETVDSHIVSLRSKLGFYQDYIRSVPYIGYCFKA